MGESVVAALPTPGNVVFDVDGCLTLQGRAIPGAGATLAALEERGIAWVIATNNSTRTPAALATHLAEVLDHPIPAERIITSAEAAAAALGPEHDPVLVVGEEGLRAAVRTAGLAVTDDHAQARSVLVGLDRAFDYATLTRAGRAAGRGALLVASNADPTFPDPAGDLPGAGALLAAIEAMAGRRAIVAGKPFPSMVERIRTHLISGHTWVVGDRPETDLALARAGGWTGVLVLTGICRDPDSIPATLRPDLVLSTVAELPARL